MLIRNPMLLLQQRFQMRGPPGWLPCQPILIVSASLNSRSNPISPAIIVKNV